MYDTNESTTIENVDEQQNNKSNIFTSVKKKFEDGSWINEVHYINNQAHDKRIYEVRVKSISRLFGE